MRVAVVSCCCLAALVARLASAATLSPCGRVGSKSPSPDTSYPWPDEKATDNYAQPNMCNSWNKPFCVVMNRESFTFDATSRTTWKFGCAECRSSCDCKPGTFCQTANSELDDWGTCVSYAHKIGSACTPFADMKDADSGDSEKPTWFGDEMLCASFTDVSDGNKSKRAWSWRGSCIHGRCRECNSYLMATSSHEVFHTPKQKDEDAKRLRCVTLKINDSVAMEEDMPFKYKPRTCQKFKWALVDASPAALAPWAAGVCALISIALAH